MQQSTTQHGLKWISLLACTGGFLFGYDTAVINGANHYLSAHFNLTTVQVGTAGASAILGCIPGALVGGPLSDRFGRKAVLVMCAIMFAVSSIGAALAGSFHQFLSTRFLGGVGIGLVSMVCPIYISECAPAGSRGRLGTLFQLGIVVGIFVTLFTNAAIQACGDQTWNEGVGWRWMFGSGVFPAIAFLCLLPLAPESPRWLVQVGLEAEARSILARWVSAADVDAQLSMIRRLNAANWGTFLDLLKPRFRRPLSIAMSIAAIAQLSGINAIMYYSTQIFTTAGVGVSDAFTATVWIGLVNLVFTLAAVAWIDSVGRRWLLIIGTFAQVVSLSAVAWMLSAQTGGVPLLLGILVYIAAFAIALGPIPWVLGSELFPTELRGRAMAIVALTIWVACYAVTQTFPILQSASVLGPSKTFCAYMAVSLLGFIFTLFLVPETKGRTLEDIGRSIKQ